MAGILKKELQLPFSLQERTGSPTNLALVQTDWCEGAALHLSVSNLAYQDRRLREENLR